LLYRSPPSPRVRQPRPRPRQRSRRRTTTIRNGPRAASRKPSPSAPPARRRRSFWLASAPRMRTASGRHPPQGRLRRPVSLRLRQDQARPGKERRRVWRRRQGRGLRYRHALPARLRQVPRGGVRRGAPAGPHPAEHRATRVARHDGRGRCDGDGAVEVNVRRSACGWAKAAFRIQLRRMSAVPTTTRDRESQRRARRDIRRAAMMTPRPPLPATAL
jgi:hypothetical protein